MKLTQNIGHHMITNLPKRPVRQAQPGVTVVSDGALFSLSAVDLGTVQGSCQNTKHPLHALNEPPSGGTNWCLRGEKLLVMGLITSAPRFHSFDLSQASHTEPHSEEDCTRLHYCWPHCQ